MKKLFLLFALISFTASAQIATKSLGLDTLTGLPLRLSVWQLTIDAKSNIVVVVYNIETLSPSGSVVVYTGENKTYTRTNKDGDMRFNALKASAPGQGILQIITNDISVVGSMRELYKLNQ